LVKKTLISVSIVCDYKRRGAAMNLLKNSPLKSYFKALRQSNLDSSGIRALLNKSQRVCFN